LCIRLLAPTYAFPTIPPPISPSINLSIKEPTSANCHGSFWCTVYDGEFLRVAYHLVTHGYDPTPYTENWNNGPMNDTAFYANGAPAVCVPVEDNFTNGGFCMFMQGGKGERPGVSGQMVKGALKNLVERGCRMCGSVGLVEGGLLTANYVKREECGGVCVEARYT
ncbi:MAG: hypothetical protein Q9174_004601, partial [Haloplaca sp. 1 TL-2023]